jgi:hypothetical protein
MTCFDGLLLVSGTLSARAARPTACTIGVVRLGPRLCHVGRLYLAPEMG